MAFHQRHSHNLYLLSQFESGPGGVVVQDVGNQIDFQLSSGIVVSTVKLCLADGIANDSAITLFGRSRSRARAHAQACPAEFRGPIPMWTGRLPQPKFQTR